MEATKTLILPKPDDGLTGREFVKVTLLAPVHNSGTYTSTADDPTIDRLLADGWTLYRVWMVRFGPTTAVVVRDSGYLR